MKVRNSLLIVLGGPVFKKIDCNAVKDISNADDYDLCIEVDYQVEVTQVDNAHDIMLLQKAYGEETVFEGHLLREGSSVSVSVDPSNPNDVEVYLAHILHNFKGEGDVLNTS